MKKVILYIHGKGGSYTEAELYKKSCEGLDILGVDYNDYLPWIVNKQIEAVYSEISRPPLNATLFIKSLLLLFSSDFCLAFIQSTVQRFIQSSAKLSVQSSP